MSGVGVSGEYIISVDTFEPPCLEFPSRSAAFTELIPLRPPQATLLEPHRHQIVFVSIIMITAHQPTDEMMRRLEFPEEAVDHWREIRLFRPTGCSRCSSTGYTGRMGIYEVMPVTEAVES